MSQPPTQEPADRPQDAVPAADRRASAGGTEPLVTGMETGTDAGTPGERGAVAQDDVVAAAVEDDAPLSSSRPEVPSGGEQDDGLTPSFSDQ